MISRSYLHILLATLGLIVLSSGQSRAQSADDVLERFRASYESFTSLSASFTQTQGDVESRGQIILQDEKYRIETEDQVLVADGETAWVWTRRDNQVLVNDYDEDFSAYAPNTFFSRYPDQFDITVVGSELVLGITHDVLQLIPRNRDEPVREVILYVRRSDSLPTLVRIQGYSGEVMEIELSNIQRNPHVASNTFTFDPPAGVTVVDLRY